MTAPLLTVTDLRTYFYTDAGVARAVDGVSFTIGPRETVGLVGESGCGKSVTSLSILRLIQRPGRIEPGSRVEFEGRDLLALPEREMRDIRGRAISMIFQEPMSALNPVFTVGDQIAEVLPELQQRVGMSILLITHDLGVIAETATRVIVMYAGEVAEEAPVEALFASPHHPYTEG